MIKKTQRSVEIAEIAATMQSSSGRNVLSRILIQSGLYDSTFVKDNTSETLRRSIRRDFGLWLEQEIKTAAPDFYFTLLKEIEDERAKRSRIDTDN